MLSRTFALALTLWLVGGRIAAAHDPSTNHGTGHQLLGTFVDSLKLLTIEHGLRISLQQKTRDELKGSFWRDYRRSLRVPRQWEDGDAWWVNYIGHPLHGASAGYIWLEHAGERHPDITLARSVLGVTRAGCGVGGCLQRAVRVRPAQRGVNRQRRAARGNDGLGRSRDDAGGCVWVDGG